MNPFSTTPVPVRLTRREAWTILQRLPQVVAGRTRGGAGGLVRVLQVRLGLATFRFIRHAFVTKADGGTDQAGDRWLPLSPQTVHRRARKGTQNRPKQAGAGRLKKERERWWTLYRAAKGRYKDDASARCFAYLASKNYGAKTLDKGRGGALSRILVDTGQLLKSLTPPMPPEAAAFEPPRVKYQVFRLQRNAVVLGTSRPYAGLQHEGATRTHHSPPIPQRRLWPTVGQWPSSWWRQMLRQAQAGVGDIALHMLRRM